MHPDGHVTIPSCLDAVNPFQYFPSSAPSVNGNVADVFSLISAHFTPNSTGVESRGCGSAAAPCHSVGDHATPVAGHLFWELAHHPGVCERARELPGAEPECYFGEDRGQIVA
jgi:hypothetical protein